MGNYINKYTNEAAYLADDSKQYPNVSYIVSGDTVVYVKENPANGLTVYYNVTSTEVDTRLFNGGGGSSSSSSEGESGGECAVLPTRMLVDGVEETVIDTWRFSTTGEHTVKYFFEDNVIPENFLYNAETIPATKVVVGDDFTEIGESAFFQTTISAATISQSVWSIGDNAFNACYDLVSVTVNRQVPPTLGYSVFDNNASGRKIYVPASALEDYQSQWDEYANDIEAIQ